MLTLEGAAGAESDNAGANDTSMGIEVIRFHGSSLLVPTVTHVLMIRRD
jgi:hypothetical protein